MNTLTRPTPPRDIKRPAGVRALWARWRRLTAEFHSNRRGATTLEWVLLLAAIALPSYVIFIILLETLVAHYRMMVMLNHLPFP